MGQKPACTLHLKHIKKGNRSIAGVFAEEVGHLRDREAGVVGKILQGDTPLDHFVHEMDKLLHQGIFSSHLHRAYHGSAVDGKEPEGPQISEKKGSSIAEAIERKAFIKYIIHLFEGVLPKADAGQNGAV